MRSCQSSCYILVFVLSASSSKVIVKIMNRLVLAHSCFFLLYGMPPALYYVHVVANFLYYNDDVMNSP